MIGHGRTRGGAPCSVEKGHTERLTFAGAVICRSEHLFARWGCSGATERLFMYKEAGKGRFPVTVMEVIS